MKLEDIAYEKVDGVARITINRPDKRNAVRLRTLEELLHAYEDAAFDGDVKVIVSSGAGEKAFCAGGDIAAFSEAESDSDEQDRERYQVMFCELGLRLSNAMRLSPKPIIAAVNGACYGWGNEYLIFHDIAVAVDSATFRQPEMGLGSSPVHGLNHMLPGLIGDKRAREFILFRKLLTAREAQEIGYINKVVASEDLEATVDEYCRLILESSPQAVKLTKTMMNASSDLLYSVQTLGFRAWSVLRSTDQWREGMEAVRRQVPPDFSKFKSY